MKGIMQPRRSMTVLVLAALALGTLAPLAEADSGRGNGKGGRKGRDGQRVESRRDGDRRAESRSRERDGSGDSWRERATRVVRSRDRSGSGDRWRDRAQQVVGRSRDRDVRVDSRSRDGSSRVLRSRDTRYRSDGRWQGDRGYRSDSRWRGSRDRDVYVQKRIVRDVRPVHRSRTVYRDQYRHHAPYGSYTVWRRGSSGAVFAGFVGGLFLGATLANAAPAGFAYYDPYCHGTYMTLSAYYTHCAHHHHTRTVHVVEVADGYDYDDYHYCDDCEDHYWGEEHDCG